MLHTSIDTLLLETYRQYNRVVRFNVLLKPFRLGGNFVLDDHGHRTVRSVERPVTTNLMLFMIFMKFGENILQTLYLTNMMWKSSNALFEYAKLYSSGGQTLRATEPRWPADLVRLPGDRVRLPGERVPRGDRVHRFGHPCYIGCSTHKKNCAIVHAKRYSAKPREAL